MKIFYKTREIKAEINRLRRSGKSMGFVPTMGALHDGHLSLVKCSKHQNDSTIVSIFVNPTQFNDKNDLVKYPRTTGRDLEMLRNISCDIVFLPDEKEIYSEPDTRIFDFGGLDNIMEGKFRPGHFNGVLQVVTRLFEILEPERAYFGLKDFQQLAIIKYIVKKHRIPVEIVPCPIVRESNGLAMSSRNMRLPQRERQIAAGLSKVLFAARDNLAAFSSQEEIKEYVMKELKEIHGIEPEYFEIVNENTLLPLTGKDDLKNGVACIAAWVGDVRLIDNVRFYS